MTTATTHAPVIHRLDKLAAVLREKAAEVRAAARSRGWSDPAWAEGLDLADDLEALAAEVEDR